MDLANEADKQYPINREKKNGFRWSQIQILSKTKTQNEDIDLDKLIQMIKNLFNFFFQSLIYNYCTIALDDLIACPVTCYSIRIESVFKLKYFLCNESYDRGLVINKYLSC